MTEPNAPAAKTTVKTAWRKTQEARVTGLAFSPDSRTLFVGTTDDIVQMCEASTGKLIAELSGKGWGVALGASPDGKYLLSAGENGIVTLFDLSSGKGKKVWECQGHDNWVAGIAWKPDASGVATGGFDGVIRYWQPSSPKPVSELRDHTGSVRALVFSPSGQELVSAGYDMRIRVWKDDTPEPRFEHPAQVAALALSPDGSTLFSGGADHRVQQFALTKQQKPRVLQGHAAPVTSLAITADGHALLSAAEDGKILRWSVPDGENLGALLTFSGPVSCLRLSSDGALLACANGDAVVVSRLAG